MDLEPYLACKPLMFSVAYRMTGSVSDAEDIVQDAFVRLTRVLNDGTVIESPEAFLTTVTTRLAITHLTSARVRRESYVGAWLPEPLVESSMTGSGMAESREPGPAEHAELADSLSMAFLVLLESLTPQERAVFLLREVFGYDYPEIARITGKSEPNARQIFARAQRHIGDARPRFESSRERSEQIAQRFFTAAAGGDLAGLMDLLAPDVVMIGDGGGKGQALATSVSGQLRVARFVLGLFRRGLLWGASGDLAWVNGQPGAVTRDKHDRVIGVFVLDVSDGRVITVRSIVNPDKLVHLGPVSDLALDPRRA